MLDLICTILSRVYLAVLHLDAATQFLTVPRSSSKGALLLGAALPQRSFSQAISISLGFMFLGTLLLGSGIFGSCN